MSRVSGLGGVAFAVALVVPGLAFARVRVVDDDRRQCPSAEFQTLRGAVLASLPGDTIEVCPGLYRETVRITFRLVLRGAGPAVESRTGDPAIEAVVSPPPGNNGFEVEATDVVVERFTFLGAEAKAEATAGRAAAISTSPLHSGYLIRENAFRLNDTAIRLRSSGASETRVHDNFFFRSRTHHLHNGADPLGVAGLANADLRNNVFAGGSGIALVAPAERVSIANSHFRGTSTALTLEGAASCELSGNAIVDSLSGIVVQGGSREIRIEQNRIEGVSIGAGILVDRSTDVAVVDNTVRHTSLSGIWLRGSSDLDVRTNRVENAAHSGILVDGSHRASVVRNEAQRNGRFGLASVEGTSGNLYESNRLFFNEPADAHDADSAGPAPNRWVKNRCLEDAPLGRLCEE